MLLTVLILKSLTELSLMILLGRFVLGLLAGGGRQTNVFWRVLDVAAKPVLWITRQASPKLVLDRHVPLAAAAWLSGAWMMLVVLKIDFCLQAGVTACR